jgi:hypothetical protein
MKNDKKGMATVIMSRLKDGKEVSVDEQQEVDQLDIAAQEILMALERKDSKQLKEALKSFYEMCDSMEDEMESED